jgi:thymidine phosphorylase
VAPEFRRAVERAEKGDLDALGEIISLAKTSEPDAGSVAVLARLLAESGESLTTRSHSADIASTGGPGSLTTVLCPLVLRAFGCVVPKLAVQGRPAGGVDVLGSLAGYRVELDAAEAESCMDTAGYAHLIAGERFAPMDAELFVLRQEREAQAVPSLVAASLLSKKLAAGSPVAGLDVRVGLHGNFGRDLETAESNARLFEESATECGLTPLTFVSQASGLEQPWIGRGEALSAVDLLFCGEADEWLLRHADRCVALAADVAQAAGGQVDPRAGRAGPRRDASEPGGPGKFSGRPEREGGRGQGVCVARATGHPTGSSGGRCRCTPDGSGGRPGGRWREVS